MLRNRSDSEDDDTAGVLCYVCGDRLTSASLLPEHLVKCGGHPIAPIPHDRASIARWNIRARALFERSLPTCDCGRRFASRDARDKHAKRCGGWRIHGGALKATLARATAEAPAICPMCGRGVCLEELKDHTNACVSRWFLTASKIDGDEELLSKMPPALLPCGENDDRNASRCAIRAYNRLAAELHVDICRRGIYYAQCSVCSRRFTDPKECYTHETACRDQNVALEEIVDDKEVTSHGEKQINVTKEEGAARETSALCPICGQYEFTRSLFKHIDRCRSIWDSRQRRKPSHRRRPVPAWPEVPLPQETGREVTRWNDAVRAQRALYECPKCYLMFERSRARFSHAKKCCPEIALTLPPDSDDDECDEKESTTIALSTAHRDDSSVVCFICARRYGTASIGKHTVACEKRWVRENEALPVTARRRLKFPDAAHWPPPLSEPWLLAEYNELALKMYHDAGGLACPKCDQTFGDADARSKHMTSCCPEELCMTLHVAEGDRLEGKPTTAIVVKDEGGGGCVCYICGRSVFSVSTIAQHIKTCRFNFIAAASLQPPHRRPKLPPRPADIDLPSTGADNSKLVAWNKAARNTFLAHCPTCPGERCGRSFPDARKLEQHMAACCPAVLKTVQKAEKDAELLLPQTDSFQLGIFCHICGRSVLSSLSLPFHFSSCLRRFYAIEDEVQASEQRQPTVPPCLTTYNIGDARSTREEDEELDSTVSDESDNAEEADYSEDEDHLREESERSVILLCYTCGSTRETPDTIKNHVAECRKRWRSRELLRPRAWRRPVPQIGYCALPGPGASNDMLDAWNKAAEKSHRNTIIYNCENCGRTFSGRDRLAVHQKACEREPKCSCGMRFDKGPRGELALRSHAVTCKLALHAITTEQKAREAEPLHGVCCYLCGRRCLVSSLPLHIASCRERWKQDAEASRRQEKDRIVQSCEESLPEAVVLPEPPSLPVPNDESGVEERRLYSHEAESIWRSHCPSCAFCSRIFDRAEKLRKHQTSGCPNIEWRMTVRLSEKTRASALLHFLSCHEEAANMLDQVLRAKIAAIIPSDDIETIRIERIELGKGVLNLIGGIYGFRSSREATVATRDKAWPKPEPDESAPVLTLEDLPRMFFHGEARLVGLKVRSGVSALVDLFPVTLTSALERAMLEARGVALKTVYEESIPFSGRVRSCASAYRRRLDADARDKRNRELSLRLKRVKSVVSTRGPDPRRPQHCHAAVQRRRSARERDMDNEKIGRALRDIYRYPKSRLEKHGVKAVDCNKIFGHRTALYSCKKVPSSSASSSPRESPAKENTIHDVPKGLGVAKCAACGIVAYYGNDTTPMRPCPLCRETYYCDETCCAVDAPAHALLCSHATGRRKQWPTRMVQYWIESRSTIVARKALRRRPKPSVEQVLREIALTRESERSEPPEIDRSAVTKHRIRGHENVPTKGCDTNMNTYSIRSEADDERDAAVARLEDHRARLDEAQLERIESKRLRDLRKDAERKGDERVARKAETGRLEERIKELDARALSLAIQRRDAMRQLDAAHARDVAISNI